MNTLIASRTRHPAFTSALLSLLAVMLAAGCGELPAPEVMELGQVRRAADRCPLGVCTDPNNGKGIFVAEGSNYCLPVFISGDHFCPEFFSHAQGRVVLVGQTFAGPTFPDKPSYTTLTPQGRLAGQSVEVVSMRTKNGELRISVHDGLNEKELEGQQLLELILEFGDPTHSFSMHFIPLAAENGMPLYQVLYKLDSGYKYACSDSNGTTAFLPDRRVNSVSARVEPALGDVTMACRSGAIATCMVWGYRPWVETADQKRADSLYGSCLQAKRAAYFVQSNDFDSYTVKGTPLVVQDSSRIMIPHTSLPGIEALWSPEGAVCFSPQFRRIPASNSTPLPVLPTPVGVPECDESLHVLARQGLLAILPPGDGWLITGPVSP